MKTLTIGIKDDSKMPFLIKVLESFDFIELKVDKEDEKRQGNYDFFESAGLWEGKEIDSRKLREKAWTREEK